MTMGFQRQKAKKIKVGTILDEEIFQRLKERSAKEGKSIGTLIEDAVLKYEQDEVFGRQLRLKALESVLALKFNISDEDLREIMEEDFYDQ